MSIDAYRSYLEEKKAVVEKTGHIIDCSMINPDLAPPRQALEVLTSAINKSSSHRYTVARGVCAFRNAFASRYLNAWGISLDIEENICATSGTKDAVFHFLAATCVQGDSILITSPAYPLYEQVASVLGLQVLQVPIQDLANTGCKLILEGRVKAVILNSPNNPTGEIISNEIIDAVINAARESSISILNDFVYGEMIPKSKSLLSRVQDFKGLVESFSLSKSYSVPGWRVGSVVGCKELIQRISTRRSRFDYGTFLPLQLATATLLTKCTGTPKDNASRYNERAKLVQQRLSESGAEARSEVTGLPFLWIELPLGCSSMELASKLLHQKGIAIMPGKVFSDNHDNFARIALVVSEDELDTVAVNCSELIQQISHNEVKIHKEEQIFI